MNFGISGYLYRSAVLYYDKETETFWEQMTGKAVIGPQTGRQLKWIPTTVTTWDKWRKKHPETTVLAPQFSLERYRNTHGTYEKQYRSVDRLFFPVGPHPIDRQYKNKDTCTIVVHKGGARCYPHKAFDGTIEDGDLRITKKEGTVRVTDKAGKEVPSMHAYWFAWCVYYPKGTVWQSKK